ncbi:MAG: S9 family peptidase [Candidatus Velthaea sp.]
MAKDARGTDQVMTLPPGGGREQKLSASKNDVQQYAFSPDGRQIAYVTQDEPADPAAMKRHDDLFDVHDDGYMTSSRPLPSHLWLMSAAGGAARRLTHGTWSVFENRPPFSGGAAAPEWSADGRSIAFARQIDADDSDSDKVTIALANAATGAVRALTTRSSYEYQPIFSPRGNALAYFSPHGPGPISAQDVWLTNGMGSGNTVTASLDRNVTAALWLRDGSGLLVSAPDHITVGMWFVAADGSAPRRVALGELIPGEFSVAASGAVALVASDATHPPEVYVLRSLTSAPQRLTNFNASIAQLEQGKSQEITWTAPDGEISDGVLTYPARYQSGRKYPLVLRIHGGPEASSNLAYSVGRGAPFRVLGAAHDYAVFEPNYRGSDNLGTNHEHAIFRDPGAGPYADVMAGIAAVEKLGFIDTTRECVTGHSYGGYLTAWLIGHDTRWRCAIVSDGMVDWKEEYDLSSDGNMAWARDSLGGGPADPTAAALYKDGSPITYVDAVKTPTLIFSGTADATVPITESYSLYHALADRNVPVRFVAIPTAHHFPSDPVRIERYYRITFDWLDHYLR